MNTHIIAIATYGSHRVKHPHTGQMVSAYKLGYTSVASAVLLALYRNQAQDVSSKHASYHYVQVHAEVTVRHGYILLKVSDDELTRAEAITIQSHRPAVYRWLDGAWHELPSSRSADYQPLAGRSGPNFNPTSLLIATATGGKETATVGVITAEKSQREGQREAWRWLPCNPICTNLRRKVSLGLLRTKKGYRSPMTTIAELGETMQGLLTTKANQLAKKRALSNGSVW
jgi:hypothetical protein